MTDSNNLNQEMEKNNSADQNEAAQNQNTENSQEASREVLLERKVVELEQKLSESNDKILRALAEIDNLRRRSKEELEKSAKFAISGFVSDLVVVAENFFLASGNSPKKEAEENAVIKNYVAAMEMTQKELMKVLEKNQVKRIFPMNEKFDHNFHEAISQIESDAEEGSVLQVIQAGYSIADRLIRPALVVVAKKSQ